MCVSRPLKPSATFACQPASLSVTSHQSQHVPDASPKLALSVQPPLDIWLPSSLTSSPVAAVSTGPQQRSPLAPATAPSGPPRGHGHTGAFPMMPRAESRERKNTIDMGWQPHLHSSAGSLELRAAGLWALFSSLEGRPDWCCLPLHDIRSGIWTLARVYFTSPTLLGETKVIIW